MESAVWSTAGANAGTFHQAQVFDAIPNWWAVVVRNSIFIRRKKDSGGCPAPACRLPTLSHQLAPSPRDEIVPVPVRAHGFGGLGGHTRWVRSRSDVRSKIVIFATARPLPPENVLERPDLVREDNLVPPADGTRLLGGHEFLSSSRPWPSWAPAGELA